MNRDTDWNNLLLRIKSVAYDASRGRGYGVVNVRLVVRDGELVAWSPPQCTTLEPASTKRIEDDGLVSVLLDETEGG